MGGQVIITCPPVFHTHTEKFFTDRQTARSCSDSDSDSDCLSFYSVRSADSYSRCGCSDSGSDSDYSAGFCSDFPFLYPFFASAFLQMI